MNTSLNDEQREKYQNTTVIRDLLGDAKTIAVVGMSAEKTKASNIRAAVTSLHGES